MWQELFLIGHILQRLVPLQPSRYFKAAWSTSKQDNLVTNRGLCSFSVATNGDQNDLAKNTVHETWADVYYMIKVLVLHTHPLQMKYGMLHLAYADNWSVSM